MTAIDCMLYAFGILVAGAVLTLLVSGSKRIAGWLAFLATAASSFLALVGVGRILVSGQAGEARTFFDGLVNGTSLRLYIDGLSGLFIGIIAVVAVMAALFSIKYMEHYKEYGAGRYYPYFLLFIAGMYGIVTTTDLMLYFCLFWQLMTLTSYALIRYENKVQSNVVAANKYLFFMELSVLLVMAGAYMLGDTGSRITLGAETIGKFDFEAISHHIGWMLQNQGEGIVLGALMLMLVGFGIKAGMWPFGQWWLPDAHPAAPSPVSAMLSGVMIKTGIYGILRTFLWMIPSDAIDSFPAAQWGMLIAVLGTITLFVGALQALKQEQTKRLLAFSSISQIGYILLGIGAAIALYAPGESNTTLQLLASLGLLGALFHTMNHACFKSLLFLTAGSVMYATDTQDMNKLGGLIKLMPATALLTLIASFSISGVPLFNGFASKWTIYSAVILGSSEAKFLAVCGIFAILTSVMTLAYFMKFFGATFLSRRSDLVNAKAEEKGQLEGDWTMLAPQSLLGALCVLLGIAPAAAYGLFLAVMNASRQGLAERLITPNIVPAGNALLGVGLPQMAAFTPLVLAGVVLVLMLLVYGISRVGGAVRRVTTPWLCGYVTHADEYRYNAHNLYGEFKKYFNWVGAAPRRQANGPADKSDEKPESK